MSVTQPRTETSTDEPVGPDAVGPDTDGPEPDGHDPDRRGLSWPMVAGAAAALLIIAGIGVWQLGMAGGTAVQIVPGDNVAVTGDVVSIDAHNSPTVVTDPADADRLVVGNRVDRPRFTAALHGSSDAGATWTELPFPTPPGEDRPYAPDLAWTSDGTLHLVFVTLTGRGNNPEAVWSARSQDAGRTWSAPERIQDAFAFQVRLAADPASGDLLLTWLQASQDAVGTNAFVATGLPILASRSPDGGRSWSEPVQVSAPERERVGAAVPAVGADGRSYVLYTDFGDDRRDWQDLDGPVHDGTFTLVLARSDGEGLAFDETVVDADVVPFQRFLVYQPTFPGLAVDPDDGTLYVAWADARNGDPDVLLRRSDDDGQTWSAAVRVNDDDVDSGAWQQLPALAVAPGGRVDMVYLDRRDDDTGVLAAAMFAASADRGATWSTVALSDVLFDTRIGPGSERDRTDLGSRIALTSTEAAAYPVWVDTRRGRIADGRQDLFSATVRMVPV